MRIVVHSLVKNEDQWIWYSLNSVIDYVEEIMVWDTGSTDQTVPIIRSINSPKIKFRLAPAPTPKDMTQKRQAMLDQTRADWLLILDGDEIWTQRSLNASLELISQNRHPYIVNRFLNLVGDVYHFQDKTAGRYHIGPHSGHVTIRFLNLNQLKHLKYLRDYPLEALSDGSGQLLQDIYMNEPVVDAPYLHATHLRHQKFKYELGLTLPPDFSYPPSFYLPHPPIVPSPWTKRSLLYLINALWQTPLKYVKRRFH